jgi:hypothetical protein
LRQPSRSRQLSQQALESIEEWSISDSKPDIDWPFTQLLKPIDQDRDLGRLPAAIHSGEDHHARNFSAAIKPRFHRV